MLSYTDVSTGNTKECSWRRAIALPSDIFRSNHGKKGGLIFSLRVCLEQSYHQEV